MRLAKLQFLESMIKDFFKKIGTFISYYPWWVLLGVLMVLLACLSGFRNIEMETNIYTLFSIKGANALSEQANIEKLFPNNPKNHFEIGRFTSLIGANRVIITTKDNQNALQKDILREIVQFDSMVKNISFHLNLPGRENETFTYQDICSKSVKGECFRNRVVELLGKMEDNILPRIGYPLTVKRGDEEVIPYFNTLGGVELDSEGEVISSSAICLTYFTNPDFDTKEYPWEKGVLDIVLNQNFTHINISFLSFNLLGDEMYKTAFGIMPYGIYTGAVMVIISFIGCSFGNCVTTKSWIGVIGIVASFLGGVAGFGLCQHLQIPFVPPSLSILFVIVGVGMDDSFVILAAWRRTSPTQSVSDRMSLTLEQSGLAITISSLTNVLCFLIGSASPFSFAYCFCMYAAVGIALDYIFTVCVVGAALSIMGRAEFAGYNAIFCLPTISVAASTPDDPDGESYLAKLLQLKRNSIAEYEKSEARHKYFADQVGYSISRFVSSNFGKCVTFAVYAVYLFSSIWGLMNLTENFDERHLFYKESYTYDHHSLFYKYFSNYMFRLQIVLDEPLEYWNPEVQDQVENLTKEIENLDFMSGNVITESWLRDYKIFLKASTWLLWNRNFNEKRVFFKTLLNPFLKLKHFKRFNDDIIFNENKTEIISSRILTQSSHVRSTYELYGKVVKLREIAKKYPFKVSMYHPFFLIADHLEVVTKVTVMSLAGALVSMLFIFFFFIPHFKHLIAAILNLLSIELGTIGFLVFWGVQLETMTTVTLIMCLGFCIDNISHVICAFVNCKEGTVEDRIKDALGFVFSPIMLGFVSTVIATFALVFANAIVYITIFKIVFTTLFLSTVHSLFILPIVLNLLDRSSPHKPVPTKEPCHVGMQKLQNDDSL